MTKEEDEEVKNHRDVPPQPLSKSRKLTKRRGEERGRDYLESGIK
jgi:hypothetical protein